MIHSVLSRYHPADLHTVCREMVLSDVNDESDRQAPDELELAYRQALQALEAAEQQMGDAFDSLFEPVPESPDEEPGPIRHLGHVPEEPAGPTARQSGLTTITLESAPEVAVTAREIVEALLFVGGQSLTAKRIASVLGGSHDPPFVERVILDLNQQYQDENRPYEIQLQEGGYHLELRVEFEPVRNRVFGLGPKEVKLSADALEVLALVAYLQPITRAEIEQKKPGNAGSLLRQLLRRELITVRETDEESPDAAYETTPRFLEVFGLMSVKELPRAGDVTIR